MTSFLVQHPHGSEISGVVTYCRNLKSALESVPGYSATVISTREMNKRDQIRILKEHDILLLNSNQLFLALAARFYRKKVSIKYHWPFWLSTIDQYAPMPFHRRLREEIRWINARETSLARRLRGYLRLSMRLLVFSLVPLRIACSDFTAQAVDIPKSVIGVVNPFAFDAPSDRSTDDVQPGRIVYVGRLSREKGVDILVRALAKSRRADLHLVLVGDGPERSQLESLVSELEIHDRVEFTGRKTPAEINDLLQRAVSLVYPARWQDPAPYPPLEAANKSVVTIASRVGGLPETAGPTAYYFERENVDALADLLTEVSEHPGDAVRRGNEAATYARHNYSPEAAVLALVNALGMKADFEPEAGRRG